MSDIEYGEESEEDEGETEEQIDSEQNDSLPYQKQKRADAI